MEHNAFTDLSSSPRNMALFRDRFRGAFTRALRLKKFDALGQPALELATGGKIHGGYSYRIRAASNPGDAPAKAILDEASEAYLIGWLKQPPAQENRYEFQKNLLTALGALGGEYAQEAIIKSLGMAIAQFQQNVRDYSLEAATDRSIESYNDRSPAFPLQSIMEHLEALEYLGGEKSRKAIESTMAMLKSAMGIDGDQEAYALRARSTTPQAPALPPGSIGLMDLVAEHERRASDSAARRLRREGDQGFAQGM